MIILNSKKSNSYFEKNLEKYKNTLNFHSLTCPKCGSHNYVLWGFYERGVIYYKDGDIHSEIVKIQRIRCKSCGSTHALLPFGITPYKQLTDEVLINLLLDEDSNGFFNYDTILKYKKQFKQYCYPYLSTILKTTSISKILNLIQKEKDHVLLTFIKQTNRCFMQIKLGFLILCPL